MKKKNGTKKRIVYLALSVNFLHSGHLKIIKLAKQYGNLIIGLMSDKAIIEYKSLPLFSFSERKKIIENITGIHKVIKQDDADYSKTLNKLKPDYFVHGSDWKFDNRKQIRNKVIKILKKINCKLIEPVYQKKIDDYDFKSKLSEYFSPDMRVSNLKRAIESKKIVKVLESHNSLTGLIIDNLKNENNEEFDAMWSSSLTDSLTRGKPDNQSVDFSTRINGLNEMMDVTTKPVIFDADNGGRIEHMHFTVKTLERIGVSAMIIEDKVGLKQNSLFDDQKKAFQDSIEAFSKKIGTACKARRSKNFMVIARIESFILGKGLNDALKRAIAYSKAGADAILIHSKEKTPKEIFSFSKQFCKSKYSKPLVCVPSTYSSVTEKELILNKFKIVIYANQMLRSAYPAMLNTAKTILKNKRSYQQEKKMTSIKDIISLIN
jgi:phosphoenolpyruvate phosphomutase / 2-hydroxyethylphosphonate cytidylyltransferase